MDAALAGIIAAVAGPTAVIVGAIYSTARWQREGLDALRTSVGAKIDGIHAQLALVTKDVALLTQRVDAVSAQVADMPAQPVDEADCRERHEATDRRVADLQADVRSVVPSHPHLAHAAR